MSEPRRRIAITGLGAVTAFGSGVAALGAGLRAGECRIGPLTLLDPAGYRVALAAEASEIRDPQPPLARWASVWRRRSRTARLALAAAWEAWQGNHLAAGLSPDRGHSTVGVVLGTTTGGMLLGEEGYRRDRWRNPEEGPSRERRVQLARWLETPVSVVTDDLASLLAADGPRLTVSTACSSGANAIGIAARWIRSGRADIVLTGGADALCRTTYSGFHSLQSLDSQPCRPFDRERGGLSLGEGAAMLVLEDWERAHARGAQVLAELLGAGVSTDAHHPTQPDPSGSGLALAMRQAMAAARIAPEDVDHVNAHGTGTPLNDPAEVRAIKTVLGDRARRIPVSSIKSMLGHTLAAAGAIEAVASVLSIRDGFVPPTATLRTPDPECDLDHVPGQARSATIRTVLSTSLGFGGNDTCLVLRGVDSR